MPKPRIAVVFGGRNSEHAVSLMGAGSVLAAIDHDKYDVIPIGIDEHGKWVLAASQQRFAIEGGEFPRVETSGPALMLPSTELVAFEPGQVPAPLGAVDVVFPVMHGPFAEDGTIQGLLELAGVRYVGSGVLASAVGMDKAYMKTVVAAAGLPIGRHVVVRERAWRRDRERVVKQVEALGWPVFVKPARAGSSQGISRASNADELVAAVEFARTHDPKVMVEAAVVGREIEVAVLQSLGDEPPLASAPGEIMVGDGHGFFDFEAKYQPGEMDVQIPTDTAETVRAMAVQAFEALDCEGVVRVDFFYTPEGRLIFNEINTMPGFTDLSVAPQLLAHSGISYPELVEHLIQLALTRPVGLR